MDFNSSIFLVWFLPVFIALYLLAKDKFRNGYLLLVSILVYAWAEPKFIIVLLITTCLDFYLVKLLHQQKRKIAKKAFLLLSVLINVGLLVYFKYSNFFIGTINELFGSTLPLLDLLLPLGISFYTFETITYVVDVYRGVCSPQNKLNNYLLYIFFFPKMVAGPIVRYVEMETQLFNNVSEEKLDNLLNGFYRFCLGLAKKVLIANQLALYGVDKIFYADPNTLNGFTAWVGIIGYTMQIYFDFSAYSDMAIGLSKMVGFRIPENFNSPYLSASVNEFWKRWHITLGEWLKNYLYIPLGGNRGVSWKIYFNLWLVFIISGLWHKGSWSLIMWGAFHGTVIVLERLFSKMKTWKAPHGLRIISTFFLVAIGFVLFRSDNLSKAMDFYNAMLFTNSNIDMELRNELWFPLGLAIVFSFIDHFSFGKKLQEFYYGNSTNISRHIFLTIFSLVLFVLALSYTTSVGFTPFIYFRF